MILIYTESKNNRIVYILNLIFRDILRTEFRLTTDAEEYLVSELPSICYARQPLKAGIFIYAHGLLHERGIGNIEPTLSEFKGLKVLFHHHNKTSAIPYDLFSATFYMVSRYEEYLPHKKDHHGRFAAAESLAGRNGFLERPVVDLWAFQLKELILHHYPDYSFQEREFQFIPTYDIDAAWAFKNKGMLRTLGGFWKAFYRLNMEEAKQRGRVLSGREQDPFDTFELQLQLQKKYSLNPIYFILFADYGPNDKNIPVHSQPFQRLLKHLSDYAEVGIHPSFNSNYSFNRLEKEVQRLSRTIHREITKSRQHFLMLQLPQTYRNLVKLEIHEDYTMGFADAPGFRAGTCTPFNFYDLDTDAVTSLKLFPFTYMDGTLKDYQKLNPDDAKQKIGQLIHEVRQVNGTFISLWHNESLSNQLRWKNWLDVYLYTLEEVLK